MKRNQDTGTQGCNVRTQREHVVFKSRGKASEEANPAY